MAKLSAASMLGRPRSALFRALGADEPPAHVLVAGMRCQLVQVFKHDSWAATALYVGRSGRVVCKFNRRQSIAGVPMHGLGCWLARREIEVLQRLADVANVPRWLGEVRVDGRPQPHVVARTFIPGHPLARKERLGPGFFIALADLLHAMHCRGLAYVDLHKRENILVGADGQPYLFDFQISYIQPRHASPHGLATSWMRLLQQADWYHWNKHRRHGAAARPLSPSELPWYILAHRAVGYPLRCLRRRLLVALGIRTGRGRASSEHFPEDAVQQDLARRRAA